MIFFGCRNCSSIQEGSLLFALRLLASFASWWSLTFFVTLFIDLNLGHTWVKTSNKVNGCVYLILAEEREWMDGFFSKYVDLYRHFHPDTTDVFSVWNQKTEARIHNEGLRWVPINYVTKTLCTSPPFPATLFRLPHPQYRIRPGFMLPNWV